MVLFKKGLLLHIIMLALACIMVFSLSSYLSLVFFILFGLQLWSGSYSPWALFCVTVVLFALLVFFAFYGLIQAFWMRLWLLLGALFVGIYFGLHILAFACIAQKTEKTSRFVRPVLLSLLVVCVAFWFVRFCLWPLGVCEGIYLLHPLRPLVSFWLVRLMLVFFGMFGALFCISLFFFLCCALFSRMSVLLGALFLFVCFQQFEGVVVVPSWFSHLCFVPVEFHPFAQGSVYEELERFQRLFDPVCMQENMLFLLPETSLPLAANTPYIEQFIEGLISENSFLLCGVYHMQNIGLPSCAIANSALYGTSGRAFGYYDKSHRVVFAERFPAFFTLVMKQCGVSFAEFIQGDWSISRFETPFGFSCVPILCSELFFTNRLGYLADNAHNNDNFVALVNDGWFQGSFFARLLRETAQLQVVAAGVSLVYVSYSYSGYFDSMGRWISV